MRVKLSICLILLSFIASTASAVSLQDALNRLAFAESNLGITDKVEWLTNEGSFIAFKKPKAFDTCKEIKRVEGKTFTLKANEFVYERRDNVIEIQNNGNQMVKSVSIEFKRRTSSSILYNEEIHHEIAANGRALIGTDGPPISSTNSSYDDYIPDDDYDQHFRLPGTAEIVSLRLREIDRVTCRVFYSENELKDIAEKQEKDEKELKKKSKVASEVATEALEHRVRKEKIFNNCIEDKLPPTASNEFKRSILLNCDRISDAPNLWNRIRYDYLMQ